MTTSFHRYVAATGLTLLFGLPFALLGIVVGLLKTLGGIHGDLAQATGQITSGVSLALRTTLLGQSAALLGLVLLLVALLIFKIRDLWVLRWGKIMAIFWLLFIPFGTVIGVLLLVYFSRHRKEFEAEPAQSAQRDGPN